MCTYKGHMCARYEVSMILWLKPGALPTDNADNNATADNNDDIGSLAFMPSKPINSKYVHFNNQNT